MLMAFKTATSLKKSFNHFGTEEKVSRNFTVNK